MKLIEAFLLCHPQSTDIINKNSFRCKCVRARRISCGTTRIKNSDLSESNDFFPTYASWNSALFETSVILTIWEHADQLIGDNHVAIMHTDVKIHFKPGETWGRLHKLIDDNINRSVGITVPARFDGVWNDWIAPPNIGYIPKNDPFLRHSFDDNINVWGFIKQYDNDIYEWAIDTQPLLIYSHQFVCSRQIFDYLGDKLYKIARDLRFSDVGFWTPHMFERVIALYLAKKCEPVLTTAFWHYAASGIGGPGEQNLYGPRPLKYYKTASRYNFRIHYAFGKK